MQDLWSARKATVCRGDLCRGSGMAKTHNLTSFSWKERKICRIKHFLQRKHRRGAPLRSPSQETSPLFLALSSSQQLGDWAGPICPQAGDLGCRWQFHKDKYSTCVLRLWFVSRH